MKVGDKVVCVDASPCQFCGAPVPLIKDNVYVIRAVREISCVKTPVVVDVIGIYPKCHETYNMKPIGHRPSRFRKLDEMKEAARKSQKKTAHEYQRNF